MAHGEVIGHGTRFHRSGDGTPGGTFATVGRVRDITPTSLNRDVIEITDMETPEKWREYIGGLRDGGEVNFEIGFDAGDAENTAFLADLATDDLGYYKIIFPDDSEWGFYALMTSYEVNAPVSGLMSASCTYKVSSKPTFVA